MVWCLKTAVEQLAALRAGKVSSSELVRQHIARIEELDGAVNAVVVRTFAEALERAAAADAALARREPWGPLHGLPITVKECFLLKGTLSTCAIKQLEGFVADSNALSVQRLLDAGAIVLGKTNLPPHAMDFISDNKYYGRTSNPHDLSRTCGGSSGGSAASLACGFAALELGSDIGGSIRTPAHWCGVFGHKPSYGLGHLHGHIPGATHAALDPEPKDRRNRARKDPSFHHDLAVSGPMARSCADLVLALRVLAQPEPTAAANGWSFSLPLPRVTDVRALKAAAWFDFAKCPTDRECLGLLHSAAKSLKGAGAEVVEVQPFSDETLLKYFETYEKLLFNGQGVPGKLLTYQQWQSLEVKRNFIKEAWAKFFEEYDVLLCPVAPIAAFPHPSGSIKERVHSGAGIPDFSGQDFNLLFWAGSIIVADLPSTVVPVGFTPGGLPCGMQIVAPNFQDLTTLEVGKMLEQCHPGTRYVPPKGMGPAPRARL